MQDKDKKTILTKRETEIIRYLAKGLLYKEIGARSSISIETVKKHSKNIYKKLNARNRTEAVNKFLANPQEHPA
jgi:DNA-binding NarL/FixJ family response regulator